jgi:hypothetical protein
MTREDLTHPVSAVATTQVKLCPYDEEEPHIWFPPYRGPVRSGRDQIPKAQVSQCSSQPAQASPSGHSRHAGCLQQL